MASPAPESLVYSLYPCTGSLCTTRRGNSPLPPYNAHQSDEQMFPEDRPQTQRQNRNEETSPPPPYTESSVPSPPASVKIKPERIKQPFEEPYLLPISETRVLSGVKPSLTKEQKRRNKCMTGWCSTILSISIALVLAVVGVSVWRIFEDKKAK